MALTAYQPTKTPLLVPTLLAASLLSTACASRQYAYGFETAAVASSGKAVIANGGVDVTTDNTFSETAFLGSPIYIRHLHLTTAMSATKETSYEGAISICLKRLSVWKRDNASPPAGIGCGAGIRDLTVEVKSGPQQRPPLTGNVAQPIAPRQTIMMDESSNFVFLTRIRRCELRSGACPLAARLWLLASPPSEAACAQLRHRESHPASAFDLRQPRRLRAGTARLTVARHANDPSIHRNLAPRPVTQRQTRRTWFFDRVYSFAAA